jgi:hypothetical protein
MTGIIEEHAVRGSKIWNKDKSLREKWVKLSDAKEHINLLLEKADENYKAYEKLDKKIEAFSEWLCFVENEHPDLQGSLALSIIRSKFTELFFTIEGIPSKTVSPKKRKTP